MEEGQPYQEGWPSLPRSVSQFFVKICFRLYERRPAILGGISLLTTEISPRRAGNFPYKRKGCLDQHFLDNFSFHKLCMFVCTNIGFRVSWENKCS